MNPLMNQFNSIQFNPIQSNQSINVIQGIIIIMECELWWNEMWWNEWFNTIKCNVM